MRNVIESQGKTVEEAVSEALLRLGARRDEVDVTVLQKPSSGFLGLIGGRPARVRVERKSKSRGGAERQHGRDKRDEEGRQARGQRGGRGGGRRDRDRDDRSQRGDRGGRSGRRQDDRDGRSAAKVEPGAGEMIASGREAGAKDKDAERSERSRRPRRRGGRGRGRRGRPDDRPTAAESQQSPEGSQNPQRQPSPPAPSADAKTDGPDPRREGRREERPDRDDRSRTRRQPVSPEPAAEVREEPAATSPRDVVTEPMDASKVDASPAATPAASVADESPAAAVAAAEIQVIDRVRPYAPEDAGDVVQFLQTVTADLMRHSGFPCRVEVVEGEYHRVKLVTDDRSAAVLIGRHGASVDAIEHIVEKVASHTVGNRIKMNLDINNYRRRREEQVVQRARNAVAEARNTGEIVHLESMCARERRVVHLYVQEQSDLATYTESDADGKHVVVLKEDQLPEGARLEAEQPASAADIGDDTAGSPPEGDVAEPGDPSRAESGAEG